VTNQTKKHINITISGRVQGVGFRYSARSVAKYMNITGFARNIPGNKVYIEAEGDETQLKDFVEWCHKGPSNCRVDNVAILPGEFISFDDFEVRF
jgi:acylphosphatase